MRGQSSSHAVYVISKKFFVTVWEAWGPSEVRQPTHNTSKAEMNCAGCTDGEVEGGQGETNATRKKKEQIFHICSSNASKGILYLRMNGSWATKHLRSHNPADLNRAVYLLRGGKKASLVFWYCISCSPSCCCFSSSVTLHEEPTLPVLCRFCPGVYNSAWHLYSSHPAWAATATKSRCFPRERGNGICVCKPEQPPP